MTERTTYDRALTLLGVRARSIAELRRLLLRKGEPPADVEAAVDRLCEQRVLDDADFARQFARARLLGTGASRRRIVQELSRKGVARDVAEGAIRDLEDTAEVDPAAAARRTASKKWASLGTLDALTRRRRLYAFLARRGFDPDEIRVAVAEL